MEISQLFVARFKELRIALGFGLGVFIGVMPGVGSTTSLLLAFIFRVNRASALIGTLIFNTWASIVLFITAIKLGTLVSGHNYSNVIVIWNGIVKDFKWEKLFEASFYDILMPVGIGYLILSLFCAGLAIIIAYPAIFSSYLIFLPSLIDFVHPVIIKT